MLECACRLDRLDRTEENQHNLKIGILKIDNMKRDCVEYLN